MTRALRWPALALAILLGACRTRTPSRPVIDWKPAVMGVERAGLLLIDGDGAPKVTCLPGPQPTRPPLPAPALLRILDLGWRGGPVVAAALPAAGAMAGKADELVLLVPQGEPRRLGSEVQSARFSPDASALAYELRNDGDLATARSYVLELASGRVSELGGLLDPRWEADGRHLRATRLRSASDESTRPARLPRSLRARWDRETGRTSFVGPGSAQIPAPTGTAVAWTESSPGTTSPGRCSVLLSPHGGVRHSAVGQLCLGVADDRAVRWSADGQWLAFPHPPAVENRATPGRFFVDVVSMAGGRSPALSALQDRVSPQEFALAPGLASPWLDWSPSGRFLALQDGTGDLRVYDFESQGIARLGKGENPLWSPGGSYLLIQVTAPDSTARNAFVLQGVASGASLELGPVRDARWLPPVACERE